MKSASLILLALLSVAGAPGSEAQTLRYMGKDPDAQTGWIEVDGVPSHVAPGVEVPAWGSVTAVTDHELIVERRRSEAEKAKARREGALVHDAIEIHIPRDIVEFFPGGVGQRLRQ